MNEELFLKAEQLRARIQECALAIMDIGSHKNIYELPEEMHQAHKAEMLDFYKAEKRRAEADFAAL